MNIVHQNVAHASILLLSPSQAFFKSFSVFHPKLTSKWCWQNFIQIVVVPKKPSNPAVSLNWEFSNLFFSCLGVTFRESILCITFVCCACVVSPLWWSLVWNEWGYPQPWFPRQLPRQPRLHMANHPANWIWWELWPIIPHMNHVKVALYVCHVIFEHFINARC